MRSICMLLHNDYEFDGRVRRKAEALVAAGYKVDVLALRPRDGRKTYTLNGVHVYTIALSKKRGSLARYVFEYVVFFCWALARVSLLMRRRRYAAIESNTLPDFLIFAAVFGRRMGAKLILDMHEITPEFYMSKYCAAENSRMVRLMKLLEKASFDFADYVITINEPVRDLLVSRGLSSTKVTVIMNAADEAAFYSRAGSATPAGAVQKVDTSTFVMMYHGSLTSLYGLQSAIEAFSSVHDVMPGAEFWILGSGPEKDTLAARARELHLESKVRSLGPVPPTDIPAWLNKCDVGILPLPSDIFLNLAFPNKLSEYIIMNKPVIVSRLRTIRHYFSEEALAYFVPNDSASLAKEMVRLYRDAALRARLAARAHKEYAAIRWDVMKQRYLLLLDDMVGSSDSAKQPSVVSETIVAPQ